MSSHRIVINFFGYGLLRLAGFCITYELQYHLLRLMFTTYALPMVSTRFCFYNFYEIVKIIVSR